MTAPRIDHPVVPLVYPAGSTSWRSKGLHALAKSLERVARHLTHEVPAPVLADGILAFGPDSRLFCLGFHHNGVRVEVEGVPFEHVGEEGKVRPAHFVMPGTVVEQAEGYFRINALLRLEGEDGDIRVLSTWFPCHGHSSFSLTGRGA